MQKLDCYIFVKMLYYYRQGKSTKIFVTIKAAALKINSEPQFALKLKTPYCQPPHFVLNYHS